MATGCQNSRLQPASKNMYPVPWLSVATGMPVSSDKGTSTEYTTEQAMPVKRVYLAHLVYSVRNVWWMLCLFHYSRAHAYGRQQFPSRRPVQRIVRVIRRRGHQDNVPIAAVEVAGVQDMLQVNQGDGAWDGRCVDIRRHGDEQAV